METINIRLAAFEEITLICYIIWIEKTKLIFYDIPIAALTEYLAYLDAAEDRDMDGMSNFC